MLTRSSRSKSSSTKSTPSIASVPARQNLIDREEEVENDSLYSEGPLCIEDPEIAEALHSDSLESGSDVEGVAPVEPPRARLSYLSGFRLAAPPSDPTQFDINLYLTRINQQKGFCKACGKHIPWARNKILSHKSASCAGISDEERNFFASQRALRAANSQGNPKRLRIDSDGDCRKTLQQPAASMWVDLCSVAERDRITTALATLFFRTGIPFNVVESAAMRDFLTVIRPAYAPHTPSARSLAGVHLNHAYAALSSKLTAWISESFCYSLVSDGWSNSQNQHFVNYVVVIPGKKPFFYKSVHTSGTRQTSKAIAQGIVDVMEELGPSKCVSVVTDNAANMRGAWDIIETKYPIVFANGCGSHVLNLLVKDLCTMPQFSDTVDAMIFVVRFVNERQHILAFVTDTRRRMGITRKLVLPAPTRWYSHYNACARLHAAKFAVLSLLNAEGSQYLKQTKCQDTVKKFKTTVDDPTFWKRLEILESVLKFPTNVIGKLERDTSDISKVYSYFMRLYDHFSMSNIELASAVDESTLIDIRDAVENRWKFIHTASMGFAYLLNPADMKSKWLPHDKADTQAQLKEYVRVFYDDDEKAIEQCDKELRDFLMMELSASPSQMKLYTSLTGLEYWTLYGATDFPRLGVVAKRLFTIPTSSAAAERTWSAFSFMWSKRRNRLLPEKVEKLVFLYTNAALLDDKDSTDYIQQLALGGWSDDPSVDEESEFEA